MVTIYYKDYIFNNVPITTKGNPGSYYNTSGGDISTFDNNAVILNIKINDYSGASSSFVPFSVLDSNRVTFISDVSQTVKSITVRVFYVVGVKKL